VQIGSHALHLTNFNMKSDATTTPAREGAIRDAVVKGTGDQPLLSLGTVKEDDVQTKRGYTRNGST
jgi:hypothetical protein